MPRRKAADPESRGAGNPEIQPVANYDGTVDHGITVPNDSTDVEVQDNAPVDNSVDKDHPKYPHLENLARYDEVLRCKRVVVQEKLDGCNVRFGLTREGEFWAGSRNQLLDMDDPAASYGFVGWLVDHQMASRLVIARAHGLTFYGEWIGRKVQRRINYKSDGFFLFDIRAGGDFETQGVIDHWASRINVSQVPRRYWGKPDMNTLTRFRDTPFAGDVTEGIVIKADPPRKDERGDWVMAKYKAPAFEEVAKAKKRTPREPQDNGPAQEFVDKYVTKERMHHVFQQAAEEGFEPADIRSTGRLLALMHADIVREGVDDYQALDQTQQKAVGKLHVPVTKALIEELIREEREEAA